VLFEPEIPPNTGNVIRLCANTGATLHLVGPLGFRLDARSLRRAGLDYAEVADVHVHAGFEQYLIETQPTRWFAVSTRGTRTHDSIAYRPGDSFVFGPESRGLPDDVLGRCAPEDRIRIPMLAASRSLNLSNAVAVVVYEAWRQLRYDDSVSPARP
jgi:tRNA (cytidine/uridine-2'-O-)-methyltransferase